MTDFLLELRSEEIPARMQVKAKDDLARLFAAEIVKAGLSATAIESFATPRRLALIARGLPEATEASREETKGPKVGAPPQALEGFLRKTGLTQDQLTTRDGVYFAVIEKPGRRVTEVLAEAVPAIVRTFPWPKSMRWGAASSSTESLRWVRPLQGIVALLGDALVPCAVDGITSGRETAGHRFLHAGPVRIGSAASYVEDLRAAHVIVHFSERCAIIREGAAALAAAAGCTLVEDEGLVVENAGLTEWPVPLAGHFDPAFLAVPQEVIALTARTNQKYFVMRDEGATLAPRFVCVANIAAPDGGKAIVGGNERVLAARLSDAKFFWENDLRVPLAEQAAKLDRIVFHEKLGTIADKVERVAKLARWLCEQGIVTSKPLPFRGGVGVGTRHASDLAFGGPTSNPSPEGEGLQLADLAERAARLCKADLVTGMVGEFPELQGIIGGHLARAQGEHPAVADAIRDHYKPVGQGDDVPTDPVTVAVSLADKLDTLASFFHAFVRLQPTGSKDPFALRRAALAVLSTLQINGARLPISKLANFVEPTILETVKTVDLAVKQRANPGGLVGQAFGWTGDDTPVERLAIGLIDFFADRLKVQQREAGVRHDLIDAVYALGGEDDLVRLLARVKALQTFVETPEGADLHAAYKRAANILKQAENTYSVTPAKAGAHGDARGDQPDRGGRGEVGPGFRRGDEEVQLERALDAAEPRAAAAIEAEDFEAAMSALASLRGPIDAFFEGVMVNDPDAQVRAFRLGLLARFRDAVHRVADFAKIEG